MRDTDLEAKRLRDDSPVWFDDVVEVFVDSKHDADARVEVLDDETFLQKGGEIWGAERVYLQDDDYHISINVRNTISTSRGKGLSCRDSSWSPDIMHAVEVRGSIDDESDTDSGYTVEMAIRWKAMKVRPRRGRILGLELAMEDFDRPIPPETKARHTVAWSGNHFFSQPHLWPEIVLQGGPAARAWGAALAAAAGLALLIFAGVWMVYLKARLHSTGTSRHETIPFQHTQTIVELRQFIEANYANPALSTGDAARHLGISKGHLQNILRQEFRTSFREMLASRRIDKAEAMLAVSDQSMSEICYATGFSRPDVFSATFRKFKGLSPSEVRASKARLRPSRS